MTAGASALVAVGGVAPAQVAPEPVTITLAVKPKLQVADFGKSVTISGKVTGTAALAQALQDKRFELEVEAIADGYNRPVDVEAIVPKADGSFSRKYDIAVNSRITLKTPEG